MHWKVYGRQLSWPTWNCLTEYPDIGKRVCGPRIAIVVWNKNQDCWPLHRYPLLYSVKWNAKVHNRVHNSPLFVLILCQMKPVHALPSYCFKIYLILSFHLHPGLSSSLLPTGFSHQNPLFTYPLSHTCHMSLLSYSPCFDITYFTSSIDHEVPHCAVFSIPLLPRPT
jgi:hypothetical protein